MDEKKIYVEIITPQAALFSGNADAVTVPGAKSPFQVLYNHAAIVSALEPGIVIIKNDEQVSYFASDSGLAEVRDNKVSILVEAALLGSGVDISKLNAEREALSKDYKTETIEANKEKISNKIKYIDVKIKAKSYYS